MVFVGGKHSQMNAIFNACKSTVDKYLLLGTCQALKGIFCAKGATAILAM